VTGKGNAVFEKENVLIAGYSYVSFPLQPSQARHNPASRCQFPDAGASAALRGNSCARRWQSYA
jgi:hypothetical protein